MERLASIQPLPRGERLASIAGVFVMSEKRRELMLQWSFRYTWAWQTVARAFNSKEEAVRMIAAWRAHAAPLRKAREERRALRVMLREYGRHQHGCLQEISAEYLCECGWSDVRTVMQGDAK